MKQLDRKHMKRKYDALRISFALLGLFSIALSGPALAGPGEMGMGKSMKTPCEQPMTKGMQMKGMDMMKMMGMMHGGNQGGMGMMNMDQSALPPSALPGFPGTSNIYHIGATGFFLDHPEHLNLSSEQNSLLNKIKEESGKEQEELQNKVEALESELWTLTGSNEPDIRKITDKVKAIETLQAEKRLSFIQAVGKAANTLDQKQREALVGNMK
ncbi:periplasmic heavy metal sensor [Methylobacter sp. BBA5.1]|uniref:periplasmic heavy metal sensor n=1 Tax=Methylobacter sp. BBA5.1 TaxID=1495064 RepID=UPI00126783F8|nr:periplasmic heavy metal sensor [Methylobacter sp. BBA5.1]